MCACILECVYVCVCTCVYVFSLRAFSHQSHGFSFPDPYLCSFLGAWLPLVQSQKALESVLSLLFELARTPRVSVTSKSVLISHRSQRGQRRGMRAALLRQEGDEGNQGSGWWHSVETLLRGPGNNKRHGRILKM